MTHFLTDPWAPHPVVNKHICHGGGGGGGGGSYQVQPFDVGNAPDVPDYTKYIEGMTGTGNQLQGYGKELFEWAKQAGVNLQATADEVSGQAKDIYGRAGETYDKAGATYDKAGDVYGKAGELADMGTGQYQEMMAKWKQQYDPLYAAQAKEAQSMIGDLGATQEKYAGKYAADVAQGFDASKAAHDRSLRSYGLKAPGSGAQQLDSMASNQRALGQVAAAEQGRNAARNEAWQRVAEAQGAGKIYGDFANQGASIANQGMGTQLGATNAQVAATNAQNTSSSTQLAAGNQQMGAQDRAASTTASLYAPGQAAFNAAYPWMKQEGDTTATSYNQALAGYNASTGFGLRAQEGAQRAQEAVDKRADEADSGSGIGGILGSVAGTVAGSVLGPAGSAVGGKVGSALTSSLFGAKGGYIDPTRHYAEGGEVEGGDQVVTPDMSQSEGAITDDVPARLNVGEFVVPKDVVEWRGEAWFQKEIAKARKEREANTVAEPEMGPPGAIDMQAPQFQSGEPPL